MNAPYTGEDISYRDHNILPSGRSSPPVGNQDLQQALLEGEDEWYDISGGMNNRDIKSELSEIETSRTALT